jgi:hypothetical protein
MKSSNVRKIHDSGVHALPSKPRNKRTQLGVLAQTRMAFARENRLAACLGVAFGAVVPIFGFACAHYAHPEFRRIVADEATDVPRFVLLCVLALAALARSAPTVYDWTRRAFGSRAKAVSWVVLVELGMLTAEYTGIAWMAWVSLAFLVGVNAVAAACRFALEDGK